MTDVLRKKAGGWLYFNEGEERWSAPDPTDNRHDDGRHSARYGTPPNYAVAEQADTYAYLVSICPMTKDAVRKLRAIRRAVRQEKS